MSQTLVFTDGASRGNPGPSGWGAVIALDDLVHEIGEGIAEGTNNEAELQAVVSALSWLDKQKEVERVEIYSDSTYVISGATSWIYGWRKRGWETKTGDPIKNKQLWQQFDQLRANVSFEIFFHKVKGHASIPANERADDIATTFADADTPDLYHGDRESYSVSLDPEPAYLDQSPLYFSLVDGVARKHTSWEDCQNRVSGESAKYKKVRTVAERDELLAEWGIDIENVEM